MRVTMTVADRRASSLAGSFCTADATWSVAIDPMKGRLSSTVDAAVKTAQTTVVLSSLMGSTTSAVSQNGLVALLELRSCIFSDTEPLDFGGSPTGMAVGDVVGQYYRGAVVGATIVYLVLLALCVALAAIMAFTSEAGIGSIAAAFGTIYFPAVLVLPVGVFHQGLATSAAALARLGGPADGLTAFVGLLWCTATVAAVVLRTAVYRLPCAVQPRDARKAPPMGWERLVPGLPSYVAVAQWDHHWCNQSATNVKRGYFLLLDDMAKPWWLGVELGFCLVNGAVLGIRENDVRFCRGQRAILAVLSTAMLIGAAIVRPCGARLSNSFLILNKVGLAVVAILIAIGAELGSDSTSDYAELIDAVFLYVGLLQTASQLFINILMRCREWASNANGNRSMQLHESVDAVKEDMESCIAALLEMKRSNISDTEDVASEDEVDVDIFNELATRQAQRDANHDLDLSDMTEDPKMTSLYYC